jgi:hypothetical protein
MVLVPHIIGTGTRVLGLVLQKKKFWFYVLVLKIILGFCPLPSYVLVSLSNPLLQGRLMQPSNQS